MAGYTTGVTWPGIHHGSREAGIHHGSREAGIPQGVREAGIPQGVREAYIPLLTLFGRIWAQERPLCASFSPVSLLDSWNHSAHRGEQE